MKRFVHGLLWLWLTPLLVAAGEPLPDFLWARRAGGGDTGSGNAIAADAAGSVLVAGQFRGTNVFGPTNLISAGEDDGFVAKYDASGTLLWARRIGGPGFDEARAVAVDGTGQVLVAGLFQGVTSLGPTNLTSSGESDIFLAKYSPAGSLVWARKAGGNLSDEAYGVAVDAEGQVYITGCVTGTATFGSTNVPPIGGSNNVFVAKCDPGGTFQWVRRAGGNADDQGNAIAIDAATNVWVAGRFAGTFTIGTATLASSGANRALDAFIAKYDRAGTFLWARAAGGTNDDKANAIATDASGHAYVAGQISGSASFSGTTVVGNGLDVFLARYSPGGDLVWVRKAGGNNVIYGDGGFGLALDPAGNACVAGYFSGTASFGPTNVVTTGFDDLFVSKHDPAGNLLWVRRAGGFNLDIAYALAADPDGNLLVTGFFSDTATFGTTNLPATYPSPARDMFVAKLGTLNPPTLSIRRVGTDIELSWRDSSGLFVLESASEPSGAGWNRVQQAPSVSGDTRTLLCPVTGMKEFLRLRR